MGDRVSVVDMRTNETFIMDRGDANAIIRGPMGHFYFIDHLLREPFVFYNHPQETDTMNYSTAVFLINPEAVRAMRCAYEVGSREKPAQGYIFKTFDKTLKVDDYVVVPTDTRHGMTVVKIAEVDVDFDIDTEVSMKWIIGPVDTSAYAHTLEMEEIAIAKIKSAEMRKKREDLAEKLFADKREDLATLEIANFSRSSGEASATDKSEAATADQAPTPNNAV